MSLDNDFEYQEDIDEVRKKIIAATEGEIVYSLNILDILSRVKNSAFGGGFDEKLYNDAMNLLEVLREATEKGEIECDTEQMIEALDTAEDLLEKYEEENSF